MVAKKTATAAKPKKLKKAQKPKYRIELASTKKLATSVRTVKVAVVDRYYWRLMNNRNGETLLTSQMYTSKSSRTRVANALAQDLNVGSSAFVKNVGSLS